MARIDGNREHRRVAILLGILCLILGGLWAEKLYWAYWPFNPITIHQVKVTNDPVCAGMNMIYEMDIIKHMPIAPTVKRQLVNSYIIDYPIIEPPEKKTGRQKVPAVLHIPSFVDPGMYYMRWTAAYDIGPNGRKISVTVESPPFTVRKCE